MKTTAICRFDGTSMLVTNDNLMTFDTYDSLEKYCKENNIHIDISHFHPASGLRVERNGG